PGRQVSLNENDSANAAEKDGHVEVDQETRKPGPRIRWTSMAAASISETCSSSSFAGSSSLLASLASWRFTPRVSAVLPRRCGLSERHYRDGPTSRMSRPVDETRTSSST